MHTTIMTPRFFERPILNSPYEYPSQQWEHDETGQPTNQILPKRRPAQLITPIPRPKKQSKGQKELRFDEGKGLSDEQRQYELTASAINELRHIIDAWRRTLAYRACQSWGDDSSNCDRRERQFRSAQQWYEDAEDDADHAKNRVASAISSAESSCGGSGAIDPAVLACILQQDSARSAQPCNQPTPSRAPAPSASTAPLLPPRPSGNPPLVPTASHVESECDGYQRLLNQRSMATAIGICSQSHPESWCKACLQSPSK